MSDAVVIGAGPNGLAAAIRLAEAGRQVLILEAADAPGGAVRTEELTLPGFQHDTFSSVYPAAAASPVFGRMPLAEHGLEWVHPEAAYAHPLPGGDARLLYRDLERTVANLGVDGPAWERFATPFLDNFEAVRATMLSGFPPIGGPLKLLTQAGPLRTLDFTRLLPGKATGLGARLFQDQGSRAWLYGAAMHGDTPPDGTGSAIAAFYLNLVGHAVGWPSPKGGAERLTDALVGYFKSLGGELRVNARVRKVTSAGGRVTGVETADEHFPASLVVADVMPSALTRMAELPGWYRVALNRYVQGASTVKVDWALDGPIPWENPDVHGAGTVHVAGTEAEFMKSVKQAHDGIADLPFLLLGQQSIADPTRAPEGKHTAWAYTHGPQEGVAWEQVTPEVVDRMEAQVERFAPGFRDRILARHILSPGGLEARNANLVGGDVGGGSYRISQLVFRPLPKLTPYATPLKGLYIGSAATFPGGAVHGVPGDAAARAALKG